jgi:hypothetical protein
MAANSISGVISPRLAQARWVTAPPRVSRSLIQSARSWGNGSSAATGGPDVS